MTSCRSAMETDAPFDKLRQEFSRLATGANVLRTMPQGQTSAMKWLTSPARYRIRGMARRPNVMKTISPDWPSGTVEAVSEGTISA